MRPRRKTLLIRASWTFLAGLALANAGCLAAVAGIATVGGVATYAYLDGEDKRTFPSDYDDVRNATLAALRDLSLPVEGQSQKTTGKETIDSRTADSSAVVIKLAAVPSPVPGEKTVTRVNVRIGTFGDRDFSERILDQISVHLGYAAPNGTVAVPTGQPPAVVPAGWQAPASGAPTSAGTPLGPPPPQPQSAEPPTAQP
jgi:hypothetical protein